MVARVNAFRGIEGKRYDESLALYRDRIHPEIEHEPGFAGSMLLADRDADVAYAITFWESRDAMVESAEAGRRLADAAAKELGAELTVEMLDVAFSELPALAA